MLKNLSEWRGTASKNQVATDCTVKSGCLTTKRIQKFRLQVLISAQKEIL
jgi:hypothetical protein